MMKSERILFVKDEQTKTIETACRRGAETEMMWLLAILKKAKDLGGDRIRPLAVPTKTTDREGGRRV